MDNKTHVSTDATFSLKASMTSSLTGNAYFISFIGFFPSSHVSFGWSCTSNISVSHFRLSALPSPSAVLPLKCSQSPHLRSGQSGNAWADKRLSFPPNVSSIGNPLFPLPVHLLPLLIRHSRHLPADALQRSRPVIGLCILACPRDGVGQPVLAQVTDGNQIIQNAVLLALV